jgi:hypothetical protein
MLDEVRKGAPLKGSFAFVRGTSLKPPQFGQTFGQTFSVHA